MAILVSLSILYVRSLLVEYEASRPEKIVEKAIAELADESKDSSFWAKYELPEVEPDIKENYLELFRSELNFTVNTNADTKEDEISYTIRKNNFPLGELLIKANGPAVTKLAVFTMQDWELKELKLFLEQREYTVTVPDNFTVKANGSPLENGTPAKKGKTTYTVSGVYLEPLFELTAENGKNIPYEIKNFKVIPNIYEYSISLPSTVTLKINGKKAKGTELSSGRIHYEFMLLEKPDLTVSDLYGNTADYDGKSKLPLTYMKLCLPSDYKVTLGGKAVAKEAVKKSVLPEYEFLESLIKNLPTKTDYEIAILKEDVEIKITDGSGKAVSFDRTNAETDLTKPLEVLKTVPENISANVDILKTAQDWSLFMSNDLSFNEISKKIVPDSYQYEVAKKYSTSVDRQFFSSHILLNPAFTENEVTDFTQVTEDIFSVRVHFVKHMQLKNGKLVNDSMNDRFYFVRVDGKWLLAGMKEVQENET